jgi:ABC-type transport system involved in multi-copper enzyme maturation permease subunit
LILLTTLLRHLGLPLLGKELIEQAARKRTYVIRVAYATLLFFAAYLFFYETLKVGLVSPQAVLGRGREMYQTLVILQFIGIYVFTPAITCGVLTHEKERASLQLLFLTRLGPWTILFEKLLSRLIPMLGFLILSLPLFAFAYSLGGIAPQYLWGGVWLLLISVLQMGTLALMCSAYFRTTVGAFVASYLFAAIMIFGPFVFWTLAAVFSFEGSGLLWRIVEYGWRINRDLLLPDVTMLEWPFVGMAEFVSSPVFRSGKPAATVFLAVVVQSMPILLSSFAFLLLARLFIVRRAFVRPRNPLLDFFKSLDRVFARLNENRWTKGIVLIRDAVPLPDDEPVAWRETTRRSLGQTRYLLRIFLAIEIPLIVLCLMLTIATPDGSAEIGSYLIFFLWGLAVILVSVQSASLIAGEKSHQTLDVLCATPLTAREIIRQKFRGVRRLILVLLVPFVTAFGFACWWHDIDLGRQFYGPRYSTWLYLTCAALSVGVYLPMVAWLALWIGLRTRTQTRAIIGSLAALIGWCVGPILFCVVPLAIVTASERGLEFTVFFSPMMIIILNELNGLHYFFRESPWVGVILNFIGYGLALVAFRRLCLKEADRLLGRLEAR